MAKGKQKSSRKAIKDTGLKIKSIDWMLFIPFAVFVLGLSLFGFANVRTTTSAKPMAVAISFLLLGFSIIYLYKNISTDWIIPVPLLIASAFILYKAIGVFLISDYTTASIRELHFQLIYFIVFLIGYFLIKNRLIKQWGLQFVIVVAVLVVINGLLTKGGINIVGYSGDIKHKMGSTLGNPNFLAGYLVLIIPLTTIFLYNTYKEKTQGWIFYLLAVMLLIIGLILTRGRGALGGLIFSILVFSWFSMKKGKLRNGIATTAGILFLVFFLLLFTKPLWFKSIGKGTFGVRLIIWLGAWHAFFTKPILGWGIGTFQNVFPIFRSPFYSLAGVGPNTAHVHCGYLEILQTTGIVGFAFYLSLLYYLLSAFKTIWMNKEIKDFNRYLAIGLAGGLLASLIENQIGVNQYIFPTAALFWIFAGMLLGLAPKPKMHFLQIPNKMKNFTVLLSGIVLIGFGIYGTRYYLITMNNQKATKELEKISAQLQKEITRISKHFIKCKKTGEKPKYSSKPIYLLKLGRKQIKKALHSEPNSTKTLYRAGGLYFRFATWYPLLIKSYKELGGEKALGSKEELKQKELQALEKALYYYFKLEKIAPRYAGLHHNIAMIYYQMGDYNKALPRLFTAAKQDLMSAYRYINIMIEKGLPNENDTPQNRNYFIESIDIVPLLTRGMAKINFTLQPVEEMYKRWKEKLRKGKNEFKAKRLGNNVTALSARLRTMKLTASELDKAIKVTERAILYGSLDIGDLSALLGDFYFRKGKLDKAELSYLWSLNYEPDNPYTQFSLLYLYSSIPAKKQYFSDLKEDFMDILPIYIGYIPNL